jgi:hypothetical protein
MWIPLVWLVGTLLPMIFLNRWLTRRLYAVGFLITQNRNWAFIFYFLIMFPGIVVHELSHWLVAKVLGLRPGKITLWPKKVAGGYRQLGSVTVAVADPLRMSLVGAAPLLAGAGLIMLIGTLAFDLRGLNEAFVLGDVRWFLSLLGQSLRVPDFWLWLYAIFAISNSMLPSESDRRAWLPVGLFLAAMLIVIIVVGGVPRLPAPVVDSVLGAIEYLDTALLITLLIDLIFVPIIAGAEWLLSLITGKRVSVK